MRYPDNPENKIELYLHLRDENDVVFKEEINNNHHHTHNNNLMKDVIMTLKPNSNHIGNPFQFMNPYIFYFTVKKNSSEKWIFYNTDNDFYDNHPFHFHLTSGFIDIENTDLININPINFGSKDNYSIKYNTKIAFNLKFSNFSSVDGKIPNLGFMFHCHYMNHHDMGMMGQYFIE